MQILPGFFLRFSSNFAHLSHIHRLFLSFFLDFRPLIRKIHFSFWSLLAIFDVPKEEKNCIFGYPKDETQARKGSKVFSLYGTKVLECPIGTTSTWSLSAERRMTLRIMRLSPRAET